jgi:ACS family D-galactonate transporter-like MFS transporter
MANPNGSRMRWMMVTMIFIGTAINYVDRANLGWAMPALKKEFGLGPEAAGLILGAFFWTYASFQLPSGWFVDKVGPRIAYTLAVVWWSLFTAAAAVARGFGSLFGVRLLLGAGEAPAYPTNAKVVSEWFPKTERAFATSIFDSGSRGGTIVANLACPLIIAAMGWRMSFVITGGLGLVWAVFWWRIYKRPQEHPWASQQERDYIAAGQVKTDPLIKVPWKSLFRYRTVWGMMLGFFCLNFVMYFFITWFPTYLVEARGFKMIKMGFVPAIPPTVGMLMGWMGGLTSDKLVKKGVRLNWARKIPIVAGMAVSSCIALAVVVPSVTQAIALLSLCNGSICFAAASIWSLPADVAPTRGHVASIGGIQNFASNTAGILTTYVVGKLVAKTGSFVIPLIVAGCFAMLGAFSYLFIVPEIEPLKMRPEDALEIKPAVA